MSWSKNVSCGIVVSPSFQPISHEEECARSEEHTSELQSQSNLVCRLLLEKKKKTREVERGQRTLARLGGRQTAPVAGFEAHGRQHTRRPGHVCHSVPSVRAHHTARAHSP